jgi:hypothetical protein
MGSHLSIAEALAHMEAKIAHHKEQQEHHTEQEAHHARQQAFHAERRLKLVRDGRSYQESLYTVAEEEP